MRAQVARRNFQLDGRGIKIGVISDSFNQLRGANADIASGDLPGRNNPLGYKRPVRVLKDWKPGSDEGRAMLQIIADVAPGAELLFHTAYGSGGVTERSFSRAVRALARAGANIIVDDVGFSTTFFQDGLTAQTVTEITNQGVAYFSAIGNDSNRSYESTFRPSTTFVFRGVTYEAHDFDPGEGIDLFQDVSLGFGSSIAPLLSWDQPVGKISSDMELFLVRATELPSTDTSVLAVSTTLFSEGAEQPLEQLSYDALEDQAYLVIARRVDPAAPTTFVKWLSTANSADSGVTYQYVNDTGSSGASTIYGQPNARGAVAVGAVKVRRTPLFGVNPPGLDDFSSQGGTPILFDTAGNRLSTPEIRQKPEIVGPNGVETTFERFSGFNPFFGTSAAAPHVAAVAALLLQRAGGPKRLTPAQLTQVMQRTAVPIDPAGNFRSGAGLVQADAAVLESYGNRVEGTSNSDQLQGGKVADNLLGLEGNDQLIGSKGFDALFGGDGRDRLNGDAGNDYLLGEVGRDVLVGGKGDDVLLGHQGRDRLTGGKGADLLAGGIGKNTLSGNQGRNTFVLSRKGLAVIRDFQAGQDQLALSDNLRFGQLQFSSRGNHLLIRASGQAIAELIGVTEVAAADFVSIAIRT